MIMFSTFEHSIDFLYETVAQKKKAECSRMQQLGVTCAAGYMAGAVGTIISTPADNIVSCLYNKKADTVLQAVKNIGIVSLFTRSLPIRIALVGPLITMQWFCYDTIKVLTGFLVIQFQSVSSQEGWCFCKDEGAFVTHKGGKG
eukprot:Gb_04962 [translate_table: standard]